MTGRTFRGRFWKVAPASQLELEKATLIGCGRCAAAISNLHLLGQHAHTWPLHLHKHLCDVVLVDVDGDALIRLGFKVAELLEQCLLHRGREPLCVVPRACVQMIKQACLNDYAWDGRRTLAVSRGRLVQVYASITQRAIHTRMH